MKLFVNRNEIMKMLCERHGIAVDYIVKDGCVITKYGDDEVCWEGSNEIEEPNKKKETQEQNPYQFDDCDRVTIGELSASTRPLGNKVNHILNWIIEHEKGG